MTHKDDEKVILNITNLSKAFSGLRAVDKVSFEIFENEILGIIGPNGAGKTTLFNLLTGFLKPDSGKAITDDGWQITGKKPINISRAGISRTFQRVRPFKLLDALENTTVPHIPKNKFSRSSKLRNLAMWSLIDVDLAEKKNYPAIILPYGDLKRLEIARTLATKPRLLFLDEPFAGLSLEDAFRVTRLIQKANKEGTTVVIVEHKLNLLMKLVERVIVLDEGKVIAVGTPSEIARNEKVITAYLGTEATNFAT